LTTPLAEVINVVIVDEVTTLYLRGLPRQIVREAKAVAARRGVTLAALVGDTLARALVTGEASRPKSDGELHDSMRWYEKNRSRLLRQHRGEYVAIIDRSVLDHDHDFEATRQARG
jgi:hypothetical protein